MSKRLTALFAVTLLAGLCFLGFAAPTFAAGGDKYPWADSISAKALGTNELSLQQIFNSLGYSYINAATDETGIETWCVLPGQNLATMVIEVAGSATTAKSGWYVADNASPLNQLFDGTAVPGSSTTFSVPGSGSIGFYMEPGLSGPYYVWYTQGAMNSDFGSPFLGNHAKVYRTLAPHEYLVCWEDLPEGGDQDHQDLVLKITFANQIPVVTLPADYSVFQCTAAEICFDISATDANCEGDVLTLEMVSGAGTFTTISQAAPINTSHCFTPTTAGVYQFVFKVTDISGATDTKTLNITVALNQAPVVTCPGNSSVFVCNLDPICIPGFSATDPDGNLTSATVNGVPLSPNPGSACFTPVAGVNTLTLTATDACGATSSCVTTVTVTLNQPPVVTCPGNSEMFVCNLDPICIPGFSATDPDGNLTSATVNGVPLSPNPGSACFTPVAGVNTLTLTATDACGATASCVTTVTVTLNQPPVVTCPGNSEMFVCNLDPICIPGFSATDPDGNLTTVTVNGVPLSPNPGSACFTPVEGVNTLTLVATDACGAISSCVATVTVTVNQPPTFTFCPTIDTDTTNLYDVWGNTLSGVVHAVDPDAVLPLNGRPNALAFSPVSFSGPGTFTVDPVTGAWSWPTVHGTPAYVGTFTAVIKVTDGCAEATCSFTLRVTDFNITDCPTQPLTVNACDILDYPFQVSVTDLPYTWSLVSPEAGMNIGGGTGVFTYDPPAAAGICGTHSATVRVTYEGGAYTDCQFSIDVQDIAPVFTFCPTLNDPGQHMWDYWGETLHGTVAASDADAVLPSNGCPLALSYSGTIAGPGTLTVDPVTGAWSWPTIYNDPTYLGEHVVTITVSDGCKTATCTFTVEAVGIFATVAKQHKVIPGHYTFDSVYVYTGPDNDLGGFDLLIAYDASALNLHEVLVGSEIGGNPTNFNWEYFTYRFGATGNCNGACPSGLTRIVAIADMNNGFAHPDPSVYNVNGLVAVLKFLVTSDRNYQCQFAPVGFYWLDCTDNVLSSQNGQVAYISHYVWWYTGDYPPSDVIRIDNNPGGTSWDGYGGWGGILGEPNCLEGSGFPGKPMPHAWVDFYDGGIDIACSDSIDARGDLNLNGIANEIADAVIYTQYFLVGIDAFPLNGRQGAIAASDVNADGKTLTIGDLVYLIRVVSGDAIPYAKLSPFAQDVNVRFDGKVVATESNVNIGAVLLTFKVGEDFKVTNLTGLTLEQSLTAGELKVLLYDISTKSIGSGLREVVSIEGQAELLTAEVADYNGNMLTTKLEQASLPTAIALGQNYPNPFNPETVIELALPTTGEVSLSIYNVAGQLVRTLVSGTTPAGLYQIRWDGRDASGISVSSGIYFYKVDTKDFSETRKMLLVK